VSENPSEFLHSLFEDDRKERWARKVLGEMIQPDDSLYCLGRYICWGRGDDHVTLDDRFSIEELEAIAWWMEHKNEED
jgi:hypothetical protein